MEALLRLARAQPTPGRAKSITAILWLGLGCGLDCRDLGWVRGTDVTVDPDGVHVTVSGGTRPRTVTALAAYQDLLGVLANGSDHLLIGGPARGRRNVTSTAISRMVTDQTVPALVVGRLRSTWLLTHLELRTPLPVLMAAAGLTTVRPLEDLLVHARAHSPQDAARWLRGTG